MQHLNLTPLPCAASTENPRSTVLGFVDDAAVLSLLAGPNGNRFPQDIKTLALAVDEMDYAGWSPSMAPSAQFTHWA